MDILREAAGRVKSLPNVSADQHRLFDVILDVKKDFNFDRRGVDHFSSFDGAQAMRLMRSRLFVDDFLTKEIV